MRASSRARSALPVRLRRERRDRADDRQSVHENEKTRPQLLRKGTQYVAAFHKCRSVIADRSAKSVCIDWESNRQSESVWLDWPVAKHTQRGLSRGWKRPFGGVGIFASKCYVKFAYSALKFQNARGWGASWGLNPLTLTPPPMPMSVKLVFEVGLTIPAEDKTISCDLGLECSTCCFTGIMGLLRMPPLHKQRIILFPLFACRPNFNRFDVAEIGELWNLFRWLLKGGRWLPANWYLLVLFQEFLWIFDRIFLHYDDVAAKAFHLLMRNPKAARS